MTLYQVEDEWEHNGYEDSDFYIVTYNDETDQLDRFEVRSTRYAVGRGYQGIVRLSNVPNEIWVKAEAALAKLITQSIIAAEHSRVMFPKEVVPGTIVVLKSDVQNRPRIEVKNKCDKCGGSGMWINPHNQSDERSCFGCKGSGEKVSSKATKGKMVTIPAGTKAAVKAAFKKSSRYGTWDYGTNLILIGEDGGEFRAPLTHVRLNEELPSEEECRIVAIKAAKNRNFYSQFRTSVIGML